MLGQSLQRLRKVLVLCGLAIAYPQFTPRAVILPAPLPSASASMLRSTVQTSSYFPGSESSETSQDPAPDSGSTGQCLFHLPLLSKLFSSSLGRAGTSLFPSYTVEGPPHVSHPSPCTCVPSGKRFCLLHLQRNQI